MKTQEKLVSIAKTAPKVSRGGNPLISRRTGRPIMARIALRVPRSTAAAWIKEHGYHYVPKKVWRKDQVR